MKIGLPLSQYFAQVEKTLLPVVGAIVIRRREDLDRVFAGGKDILFHANGFIDDFFDIRINNPEFLIGLYQKIKLLSFDLGPSCRKVEIGPAGYVAQGPVLTESQIMDIADRKIKNIRKYFKGTISVENLDYHPSGAYEFVCTPEFINEFIKKIGVGLTLDIGHAMVTCSHFGIDIYDYLEALPLSCVAEVHLSHSLDREDLHMAPTQKEYEILSFVLGRTKVPYITIEYYCDYNKIIQTNIQLSQFLKLKGLYEE